MKYRISIIIFIFTSFIAYSQEKPLKALFVDNFEDIVFVKSAEEQLLQFAQENEFNYLILDNINEVQVHRFPIDNRMTDDPLVNFITKARTEYNIQRISVVGLQESDFDPVFIYNSNHKADPNARIDAVFLLFEFWYSINTRHESNFCKTYLEPNHFPCTRIGGYYFYRMHLRKLRARTNEQNMILETLVGAVSKEEMQNIVQMVDVIHLEYERNDTKKLLKYKPRRLDIILNSHVKLDIFPCFKADEKNLKDWLQYHQTGEIYDIWMQQLKGNSKYAPLTEKVRGYSWSYYSDF